MLFEEEPNARGHKARDLSRAISWGVHVAAAVAAGRLTATGLHRVVMDSCREHLIIAPVASRLGIR